MQNILACVDASSYAPSVCALAAWVSRKLDLPVELLHVVQRKDTSGARHDLSGAIGLGVKSRLLEELTQLDEMEARLQIERGRLLLNGCSESLKEITPHSVTQLHRHGDIVETILEREQEARIVVMGKRGTSQEFATDHIGSTLERVVRASDRPVLIAPHSAAANADDMTRAVVLAYDGSLAAGRALERCANSPLLQDLPVTIVIAISGRKTTQDKAEQMMREARDTLKGRDVTAVIADGSAEEVIANALKATPGAILLMGAFGHSPLRSLIVGSTTTAMIRSNSVPTLLVR
jgi:nucleotide-binding universal stress UspA family protein